MNLSELRVKLRSRIGDPTVIDVPDSELDMHINSAYVEIADTYRFHTVRKLCKFSTVVGTARYGIPDDCLVVMEVRDLTNEKKLEKYGGRRVFEQTSVTTNGFPFAYARFRNWVELVPPPDGVYEIEMHYKADVVELAGDTATPTIPKPWHEGILRLAKYYYYEDQGDVPKSVAAYNAYDVWVSRKPVEVDEEKRDFDSGVSIPTLSGFQPKGLDFNHSD